MSAEQKIQFRDRMPERCQRLIHPCHHSLDEIRMFVVFAHQMHLGMPRVRRPE